MKSAAFWALLPLVLSGSALAYKVKIADLEPGDKLPSNIVPNEFIIEVDELSKIPTKRSFARSLDAIYASLQDRAVGFDVKKEYDAAGLFVGAAVSVQTTEDAIALANTPGIKLIRPIVQYSAPKPVKSHIVSGPNDPAVPPDGQSTHVLTGVDKLHAEGIFGSGIKIGIIDTGIDYNHPVLGAGFGPGNKIIGGYDFVGDDYDGSGTPKPDSDPLDECNGHGTHVAGIIGANPGNAFNISGVAYQASINAYRVFGCGGTVPDDVMVDALLQGVKDGNDILTMSIGGADGWTEGVTSVVASRIAASGKIVTIAAANDGSSGSWYSSGPGNGIDVISVASVDNTAFPLQSVLVSGVQHDPIIYYATFQLPANGSFPIYTISNDTTLTADGCDPLPESTPDLSKFVTIVRRGTCTFVQKLTNIAAKGGDAVLIYDNGNGFVNIDKGSFTNAALIQAADGEFLVKQHAAGANITLTFPPNGHPVDFPDPKGGLVSEFSSYGPSNDFYFKPAVAAPGGNILSTVPLKMGVYAVFSGTSMATPFVAGSSALLLQVKGKSKAVTSGARTLFETTAKYIASNKTDGEPLQTASQQGAGLINVYDAIHATTLVTPGELILNDTAHFKPVHAFSVKNNGNTSITYKLSHVPAGTALTVENGTIFPALGPVPLVNTSASVIVVPKTFTLEPGHSQTVLTTFKLPTADKTLYPLYSGYIQVAGPSVAETYHVSYLGLGAALKDKKVIDDTDYYFDKTTPAILNWRGAYQKEAANYTFADNDIPSLLFRLAFGTPSLRVDLVDPDLKFTPTIPPTNYSRRALPWSPPPFFTFPLPHNGGSFGKVKVLGPLTEFRYITRNDEEPQGNGYNKFTLKKPAFANGTTIKNGDYRVLVRALRVTGDPTNEADYESWLSPIVGIKVNATAPAPAPSPTTSSTTITPSPTP